MIDVHRSWVQRVENAATNAATALNRLLGPAIPQTSSTLLTALASSRNVSFRTKQPSSEGVDDRFDQLDITRPTIELATYVASGTMLRSVECGRHLPEIGLIGATYFGRLKALKNREQRAWPGGSGRWSDSAAHGIDRAQLEFRAAVDVRDGRVERLGADRQGDRRDVSQPKYVAITTWRSQSPRFPKRP
jgi:hypothetical protein